MAANAQASRNGTLRNETTLPFANQLRQKTARVPWSGGVCFPFVHGRSITHLKQSGRLLGLVDFATVFDKVYRDGLFRSVESVEGPIITNDQFEHTFPWASQCFWFYGFKIFGQPA
jgi:hypothetical protein